MDTATFPKPDVSLQRQMTITLSLVIVGLLLLVGLPMVYISVQFQRRESAREQQELADRVAQTVSNIVQSIQTNQTQITAPGRSDPRINFVAAQITAGINLASSRALSQIQDTFDSQRPIETLLEANPQIQGVAQFNLAGAVEQSLWRRPESAPNMAEISRTESFDLARQGLNAQTTIFLEQDNLPALMVAAPLQTEAGITGVIVVWVDVQTIWQTLTDFKVGETGYLYITNQAGRPIVAPPQFDPAAAPASTRQAIEAGSPYRGLGGKQVIGRIAPVENIPWQVIIEIPTAEANASLRSLLVILGAILMFGLSLAISVARLFSQWVLQPIQTLQQSALQISNGDLSHRIALERNDELGFLAGAFNKMVATLEETINELRTVSLRLLSAEEAERQRIAYEIHDELGQTLTALKFSLSMAARNNPNDATLIAAQNMATEAQEKARTLSHELRPAMLDDLGLLPTLNWYIDLFEQRANLAISLETNLDERGLPPELKTAIYRLTAEALSNIHKHAQASAVEISLTQTHHGLALTIQDDGRGFDVAGLNKTRSLGLAGMRERVNLLRGNFELESEPGRGTKIAITLPV